MSSTDQPYTHEVRAEHSDFPDFPSLDPRLVAAVYYPPDNHLEVLFVDRNGVLNVVWKVQNGSWQGPVGLTVRNFAPPSAPVAAVFYPSHNQLEVFVIDQHGTLNVIWKVKNEKWKGPVGLTTRGFAPQGAKLAAVYYPPYDQLEVFAVDTNGVLNVIWKRENLPWKGPVGLTTPEFAPPGAAVAAVYYPFDEHLEAFVAASNGAVRCIWKRHNDSWNPPPGKPPFEVTEPGLLPGGAPLAAVYYPLNNPLKKQLLVFFVDASGAVRGIWKEENSDWQASFILSMPGHAPRGAWMAAVYYPLNDQLEVFVVDNKGVVNIAWRALSGNWHPPAALTLHEFASPGPALAVVYYPLNNQLELFTTSRSGVLHVLWKVENNRWVPCPFPLERSGASANGPIHLLGTVRVGQLTGSKDPQGWPLLNDTRSWGVPGVDLGANTEHDDGMGSRLFFFFGDVVRGDRTDGPPHDADLVAWTETTRMLTHGFPLHPVKNGPYFDPFTVAGSIGMPLTNETPTGAFSYDGRVYVFIFIGRDRDNMHLWGSYLVSKADPRQPGPYREEFRFSAGFWQAAPWVVRNADHPGLPSSDGDGLVMFGHGSDPTLHSDAIHLAWMRLSNSGGPIKDSTHYFTGKPDAPWSVNPDEAAPLFGARPGYTSVSAAWLAGPKRWILLYSKANPKDAPMGPVVARIGTTPWTWSDEIELFNPCRDQAFGKYMHWPGLDVIPADVPPMIK